MGRNDVALQFLNFLAYLAPVSLDWFLIKKRVGVWNNQFRIRTYFTIYSYSNVYIIFDETSRAFICARVIFLNFKSSCSCEMWFIF